MSNGAVFYRGPSLLTGAEVVAVVTGLSVRTSNTKTGDVAQVWILRADRPPMDAKRGGHDDAVCGDCKLRGSEGRDSGCYVAPWLAPNAVWKSIQAGRYPAVSPLLAGRLAGGVARLGAYGDPAAVPFDVWRAFTSMLRAWVGYTHQWRTCDPSFRELVMASVDTLAEFHEAQAAGWRTFRIAEPGAPQRVVGREFVCPASDEAGHRSTCERCRLCAGLSSPARSVVIQPHGKPSSLRVFRRVA